MGKPQVKIEKLNHPQLQALFNYHNERVIPKLENFIKEPERFKSRFVIQILNKRLELLNEMRQQHFIFQFNNEHLISDEIVNPQEIQLLISTSPQLTCLNVYQSLKEHVNLDITEISSKYILNLIDSV
jgi:hypothetical protein